MALTEDSGVGRRTEAGPRRVAIRGFVQRRPTVALLMALVAACALALGIGRWGVVMWRESKARREMALLHTPEAAQWADIVQQSLRRRIMVRRRPITPELRDYLEKMGYDASRPHAFDGEISPEGDPNASARSQETYRDEFTAICRERADYHERMKRKWARAARMPWMPVEPDPPKPPVEFSIINQSF